MPISLNALFNVPTRAEKAMEKKLRLSDQLAKDRLKYERDLTESEEERKFNKTRQRTLVDMRAAGIPEAEATAARGFISDLLEKANKGLREVTGGTLGLPKQLAQEDVAASRARELTAQGSAALTSGALPFLEAVGGQDARTKVAAGKLAEEKSAFDYGRLPMEDELRGETIRRQMLENQEFMKGASDRERAAGMANELGILRAQMQKNYLNQIANDPLRLELLNSNIRPADLGFGVAPQLMNMPLPPLGGQAIQRPNPFNTPLSSGNKSREQRLREIIQNLPTTD